MERPTPIYYALARLKLCHVIAMAVRPPIPTYTSARVPTEAAINKDCVEKNMFVQSALGLKNMHIASQSEPQCATFAPARINHRHSSQIAGSRPTIHCGGVGEATWIQYSTGQYSTL